MGKTNVLIVGGGPAGLAAAKAASKHCDDIILCGAENHTPYWRTRLPSVIVDKTNIEKLSIVKDDWFKDNNIDFISGKVMKEINTKDNRVIWSDGTSTSYQKLILATGAKSFVPALNYDKEIFTLRYYEDAIRIREEALKKKKAVVIGGGLLGLEIASKIKKLNISVTVIEIGAYLLSKQLDRAGGEYLASKLEDENLKVLTGINANNHLELLNDTCVIMAAGIRSNIKPLSETEININRSVVVDEYMRTSVDNIYACGDLAEYNGKCYGLISVANMQGTVAGNNAVGIETKYQELIQTPLLKIDELSVMSIGDIEEDDNKTFLRYKDNNKYQSFVIKNNIMVGAIFIGDISLGFKTKAFIEKKVKLENIKSIDELIDLIKK